MNIKKITAAIMAALIIASFSGCGTENGGQNTSSEPVKLLDTSEMFSGRDIESGYDESECTVITLAGDSANVKGKGASAKGSTVTIDSEGDYLLSGSLKDGSVIIDAGKSDKIRLILNGVNINSSTCAAINVKQADKVFVTLARGSENTLSNAADSKISDDADAVVFSKDNLTINGEGKLTVTANTGHAVVSKDDLVISGGSYAISSEKKGLDANDSIRIAGGTFAIDSGADALHCESDDASKGYIYIADGTFSIHAGTDGIDASGVIQIDNGTVRISSGDDGIHAGSSLKISGGTVDISKSYEGLEGMSIDISGGTVSVNASDDGLNAAGGSDQSSVNGRPGQNKFAAQEGVYISISGGNVTVNSSGDGIDSNGDVTVSGGKTFVSGADDNGNAALDFNGEATITGGVFVAAGMSGMSQNFGEKSTQGAMLVNVDTQQGGSEIILRDSGGKTLVSFTPQKSYNSVVVSTPEVIKGGTFTLVTGSSGTDVRMDSLIYGAGGMGGGFGGGRMPGGQKGPDGPKGPGKR